MQTWEGSAACAFMESQLERAASAFVYVRSCTLAAARIFGLLQCGTTTWGKGEPYGESEGPKKFLLAKE